MNVLNNILFWGSRFLAFHRHVWLGLKLRGKGVFQGFYIESGFRLTTLRNISIRPGVVIQRRTVFAMKPAASLIVGSKTRIGSDCVLAAQERVELGDNVLLAARCLASDHNHQFRYLAKPIMAQGATKSRPISIGNGSGLGINVCIRPGCASGQALRCRRE